MEVDFCNRVRDSFDFLKGLGCFTLQECQESNSFGNGQAVYTSPEYVLEVLRDKGQHFVLIAPRNAPGANIDLAEAFELAGDPTTAEYLVQHRSLALDDLAHLLQTHFGTLDQVLNPALWHEAAPRLKALRSAQERRLDASDQKGSP